MTVPSSEGGEERRGAMAFVVVRIARRAGRGGRDSQLGFPDAAAVVNVNFPRSEAHLFVALADRMIQGIGWRRLIEKDCDSAAGCSLGKRVCLEDGCHFGGRAHNNADRLARIGPE